MNQSNLRNLVLPGLLVPCSVIVIINLLSGGGNQLGNTFGFLMVIGGILGFFSPRVSLIVFLCFQFYADFFKRLLVLGDALSMQDVMASLGLGPILIVAACLACAIQCFSGKVPFFNLRDIVIFLGCCFVSIFGALTRESLNSGVTAIGQAMIGSSMLGMSAYACYVLFRTKEDAHLVLKIMALSAIPMALYTFQQYFFGIAGWEEDYIRTGMSQVLYEFYMMDGISMRPFSTLNTHTSVGAISGALMLVCLLILTRGKGLFNRRRSHWIAYTALACLYLGACLISRNRTTYLLPILGPLLLWLFSGGLKTALFYISGTTIFVLAVRNSEWLNSQILTWATQFEGTFIGSKIGSIGTFQDRLKGFIALNDGANWAPFGLPENERPFAHDQITEVLLKFGYIPLAVILIIVTICLVWWHRKCLRIEDVADRKLMIAITAIAVAVVSCSLAYGNLLFVAPVNSFVGFLLGLGFAALHRQRIADMGRTSLKHQRNEESEHADLAYSTQTR